MAQDDVPPFRAEEPAHNAAAEDDMLFTGGTFHIGLEDVAQIVHKKGDPRFGIPGEAIQPPPRPRDEEGVNENRMDSENHALGPDFHGLQLLTLGVRLASWCCSFPDSSSTIQSTTLCALPSARSNFATSLVRPRTETRSTSSSSISPTGVKPAPRKPSPGWTCPTESLSSHLLGFAQ